LEGCPINVGGDFDCSGNQLTSLEYCPKNVGGNFNCYDNQLTSLDGCPQAIKGDFDCDNNQITDFKGISEFFEGSFSCYDNPIFEIYELFNESVSCIQWINEFDVIQDGNKVIMDRLEEVFHQLGMEIPEEIEFENYEII